MHSPRLSLSESNVLQDAQFFTTKAAIDAKINTLFAELKNKIEACQPANSKLPAEIWSTPGRIHRGEHLGAFPWRALDSPRCYAGTDIFVFRTLLVWGNAFSFHLILSGKWLKSHGFLLRPKSLAQDGWMLSVQDSPWDWTLDSTSHQPVSLFTDGEWDQWIDSHEWLKISKSHSLDQFSEIPDLGAALWKHLAAAFQ